MGMPTPWISRDLRTRIVAHYERVPAATYKSTAGHFSVGEATVNRILRVHRETGDVMPAPRPKKPKNKIDLDWLRAHTQAHPDDRLKDRADAFKTERGVSVSVAAVYYAMVAIGVTHKKKRSTPRSATPSASARCAPHSNPSSRRWTPSASSLSTSQACVSGHPHATAGLNAARRLSARPFTARGGW